MAFSTINAYDGKYRFLFMGVLFHLWSVVSSALLPFL